MRICDYRKPIERCVHTTLHVLSGSIENEDAMRCVICKKPVNFLYYDKPRELIARIRRDQIEKGDRQMTTRWEEVTSLDMAEVLRVNEGELDKRMRVISSPSGPRLLIERKVLSEVEITAQIKPILVRSKHTNGFYVSLIWHDGEKNTQVGVMGCGDNTMMNRGFRIEKAEGATVSFKIFKTRK